MVVYGGRPVCDAAVCPAAKYTDSQGDSHLSSICDYTFYKQQVALLAKDSLHGFLPGSQGREFVV